MDELIITPRRRSTFSRSKKVHTFFYFNEESNYAILMQMTAAISHDRREETIEAKALWFQSLTMVERMEVFCSFVDLALSINPKLQEQKDVEPASGRFQVISATRG